MAATLVVNDKTTSNLDQVAKLKRKLEELVRDGEPVVRVCVL